MSQIEYVDILKPKNVKNKFRIFYFDKPTNNEQYYMKFNIAIDWLMFLHSYSSTIIHLNEITKLPELFENIRNNLNAIKNNEPIYIVVKTFNFFEYLKNDIKKTFEKIKNEDSDFNNMYIFNKEEVKNNEIINLDTRINDENNKYDEEKINEINKINNETYLKDESIKEVWEENKKYNVDELRNKNENNEENEENEKKTENDFSKFMNYCGNPKYNENGMKKLKDIYKNKNNNSYKLTINFDTYFRKEEEIEKSKIMIKKLKSFIKAFEKDDDKNEFSIEKIFENYKSRFYESSSVYKNKNQKDIKNHYIFQKSYSQYVDKNEVQKFTLEMMKHQIDILTKNDTVIDFLAEDQGNYSKLYQDLKEKKENNNFSFKNNFITRKINNI
jgi:hypothetical protein